MHATPPESEDVQMIHGFCKHTTPLEAKNQKNIWVFYRRSTPLESEDEQMIHGFCKYATPPESGNPEKNREVSICM